MKNKMRKLCATLCLSLLTLSLSSCAPVTIADHEWCADIGDRGSSCFHTISNNTRELNKADWDALRFGQLCGSSDAFANLKDAIEKLCHMKGARCNYQQLQSIEAHFDAYFVMAAQAHPIIP